MYLYGQGFEIRVIKYPKRKGEKQTYYWKLLKFYTVKIKQVRDVHND